MQIPDYVTEQIERRYDGRFRIRWSDVDHVFFIEQKVRRAIAEGFAPLKFKSERHRKLTFENQVRARDGYILSMKISPGTHTRCVACNSYIAVPAFKTAQVACPRCKENGTTTSFVGGYFPLGDALLDELDRTDPDRGGNERVQADGVRLNAEHEKDAMYALTEPTEAAFRERFNRLVGIPQTGYSGATKMWTDAPTGKQSWVPAQ